MDFISWLNANDGVADIIANVAGAVAGVLITAIFSWFIFRHRRSSRESRSQRQAVTQAERPSALDRILTTKSIRAGVLQYPPLMSYASLPTGGDANGIYPRMLKRIAADNGLQIEWRLLNWSDITDAVKSQQVDLVLSIFLTPKRAEHADFVAKMHRIGVTGLVRADETRILDHEDLKRPDVRVGIVRGEIGWEYAADILNLAFEPNRFTVLDAVDIRTAADLVKRELVDVVLADALSCWLACNASEENKERLRQVFADDKLFVCENGLMIAKGDTRFGDWLQRHARALRQDTELRSAEEQDLNGLESIVRRRDP